MELFKKLLQCIPLGYQNSFVFSCQYEPTLHPEFYDYLEMIPDEFKDNCYCFTSNFVKHISDDNLMRIARCNIQYINISLETFDNTLYYDLCAIKNSHLYDNLSRLSGILASVKNAPRLKFTTMILKDNQDELIELYKTAQERYHPFEHEFRTPVFLPPNDKQREDIRGMLLSKTELSALKDTLLSLGDNIFVYDAMDIEYFEYVTNPKTKPSPRKNAHDKYIIFIRPDGSVCSYNEKPVCADLASIDNPAAFFQNVLIEIQTEDALENRIEKYDSSANPYDGRVTISLDDIVIFDKKFLYLTGFCFLPDLSPRNADKILCVSWGSGKKFYKLHGVQRPDSGDAGFWTTINVSDDLAPSIGQTFSFTIILADAYAVELGVMSVINDDAYQFISANTLLQTPQRPLPIMSRIKGRIMKGLSREKPWR
jgi:MoaA/NifB/PqqE/SkfB family radical SAM enzyme